MTESTSVDYAAATHVGVVREENQDSILVRGWVAQGSCLDLAGIFTVDNSAFVCGVLDGMGGYAGGALASRTAAHTVADELAASTSGADDARALQRAHDDVRRLAQQLPSQELMSTTAALVTVDTGGVTVTSVGDCRVYRWWEGYFSQVTVDDRVPDPRRPGVSLVSQALGGIQTIPVTPHQVSFDVGGTSTLLLCSDGLHDVVPDGVLEGVLASGGTPEAQVERLIALSLEGGAPDNVSVVVLRLQQQRPVHPDGELS